MFLFHVFSFDRWIVYVLGLFGSVYLFVKWRTKKLEKEKEVLEQKVEERTEQLKKEKEISEEQRKLVEEKQKEVLDSINYASRIQRALITSELYIKSKLNALNKKEK